MTPDVLEAAAFPGFFRALYDYEPFPWQTRLLVEVLEKGWPAALSLPTASGKTSVIDLAVFALAMEKRQPRRIFFVIDRRIVVDDAFERAQNLAQKLQDAKEGVVKCVADRLRAIGDGQIPLLTACLRGGIFRNEEWTRNPAQPTVVVSTVDQVGSRLLFRGYGVSPNAWPLHAALVANDALVVVDEAHCVQPFLETLTSVARYRSAPWQKEETLAPFSVVAMSATPGALGKAFSADASDRVHPILGRRFGVPKRARLVHSPDKDEAFTSLVVKEARALSKEAPVTGVILNTVAGARRVFEELRQQEPVATTILLTGRVRPWEREKLLGTWLPMLRVGRKREASASETPIFVVATQCIEVGADLDFDALVTECAALDALRQRFGRLNRVGSAGESQAVIVGRMSKKPHPLYGEALQKTWDWLSLREKEIPGTDLVDFGIAAMDAALAELSPEAKRSFLTPVPPAPVLLPGHCDLWCQTSPAPHHSPDVAPFLHGETRTTPDVTLLWRSDIEADNESKWVSAVALCPPQATEALQVPLYAFLRWAEGKDAPPVLDQEGGSFELEEPTKRLQEEKAPPKKVLRWRGEHDGESECVTVDEVRPGDTLILPSSWGGCDEFGWNPSFKQPVRDLGCLVREVSSPWILRLHPAVLDWTGNEELRKWTFKAFEELDKESETYEENLIRLLASLSGKESLSDWARAVLHTFLEAPPHQRSLQQYPGGNGFAISVGNPQGQQWDFSFEDQDASSGVSLDRVTLPDHMDAVREEARRLAKLVGLPERLESCCALAAWLHDLGKADPRFQLILHAGDRVAQKAATVPLAKSAARQWNRVEFEAVRKIAGYPRGTRHEVLSVALAKGLSKTRESPDFELVLGLVSTHHGRCRPLAPVAEEGAPLDVSIQVGEEAIMAAASNASESFASGFCERFWKLTRRYGWWGYAYLDLLVRLSDQRVSRREREEKL